MKEIDLILHIGLRKTGTTTFQKSIFPAILPAGFLGKSGEGEGRYYPYLMHQTMKHQEKSPYIDQLIRKVKEKIRTFDPSDSRPASLLISSEGMSTRPTFETVMKAVQSRDFTPVTPRDFPIFGTLPPLRSRWRENFGGEVKLLLTIRDQRELLASEYSQLSPYLLNPNQADFEHRLGVYLNSGDQHLNYFQWARTMEEAVGRDRILICDIAKATTAEGLEGIFSFIGGTDDTLIKNQVSAERKNVSRTTAESWSIRSFRISKITKQSSSTGFKMTVMYRKLMKIARTLDPAVAWVVNRTIGSKRGKEIVLTPAFSETIRAAFAESNALLKSEYGDRLVQ